MNSEQRIEFLTQSKAHLAADMLLKGTYANDGKGSFHGCSVGCHLHHIFPTNSAEEIDNMREKHLKVAKHYGYPEWLALLQDSIFEGLPNGQSSQWHVQLAETLHGLPDDFDWQKALHRVHAAILRVTLPTAGTATAAVQAVIDLHDAASTDKAAWSAARWAAWSAARSAAGSAAGSAAELAAYQKIRDDVLEALAA